MCTVSNVMDEFNDKWWPKKDLFQFVQIPEVSKADFEALRAELKALKDALKKAKIYDEQMGQPDCESAEKMAKLRELCKIVGIDLDSILPKPATPPGPSAPEAP